MLMMKNLGIAVMLGALVVSATACVVVDRDRPSQSGYHKPNSGGHHKPNSGGHHKPNSGGHDRPPPPPPYRPPPPPPHRPGPRPPPLLPSKALACGGIAALRCPSSQVCKDDPNDSCDPARSGRNCSGICVAQIDPSQGRPACAPDASKRYIGKSTDECSRIRFSCEPGTGNFSDNCGCGCQTGIKSGL